ALGARLLGRGGPLAHFGFGVVSGLLPCGLVWSALALAVAAGTPLLGAAGMAAFFAGTLPALAVASVALRRLTTARPWTRTVMAAAVLAAGLGSIGARAQATPEAPTCHTPP
ncbi:MAG: sulfite exporter TauE/SafE family protein, partial [Myxococcota bacterium]